jgi:hypothetical protein
MLQRCRWSPTTPRAVLILCIAAPLLGLPLMAQGVSPQGTATLGNQIATPPTTIPRFPDARVSLEKGPIPPEQRIEEGCFLPPLSVTHRALSSVTDYEVSPKAQKEYHSACNALQSQKWPEAEEHLRKAVEKNPKYAAAWVTLGQVMEMRQKERRCTQKLYAGLAD